jgi:2,3-bisphosphoglycerate-independent phosphoglycerate mutase
MKTNKTILVITDGIGHNSSCENNAFCNATKPTYDYLFKNIPYSLVKTSGLAVGLPEGQMGNSEVGHMTIGSGRILYQNLVKITKSIKENTLKNNSVVTDLLSKSKTIHIIGLVSDGGVHSHINHIIALAKIASNQNKKVKLHLITDGRDVSPTSAPIYIKQIENILDDNISIATISGRFYSMDRDTRWDRVERGYNSIANALPKTDLTPLEYINSQYQNDINDEFLEPISFTDYNGFSDNDGIIFANFRSDRMREITDAIGNKTFSEFKTNPSKVHLVTMTQYNKEFPYPIIFEEKAPTNTLAEVISRAGLKQLHTSETEKYAHVTFFFNGGIEEPFENESRVLVASPDVKTYDMKPEMSAKEVSQNVQKAMKDSYDFIVVNFANGDMVGHTGDYQAGIKAVETVDHELGKIIELAKKENYNLVLTSDHGNCEQMKDSEGNTLTNHTTFDVYCFVLSEKIKAVKTGGLNNIAPTILKLMDIEIPTEMDQALI